MEFEWTNGRVLSQITVNPTDPNGTADVYSYTYDENGIRSSKTVNGTTTSFTTKDGVILSQTDGTNTMYFQYDNSGNPTGFIYNGTQYFYLTNQMGDVIGITDNTGSLIATYTYGAWGEVLAVTPATAGNTAQIAIANTNPLRYRGYYFDQETGYYYLQSRFFVAQWGRFLLCDRFENILSDNNNINGANGYTYCDNNPLNYWDPYGEEKINIKNYMKKNGYYFLGKIKLTPKDAYFADKVITVEKKGKKTKRIGQEIIIEISKEFLNRSTCTTYSKNLLSAARKDKNLKYRTTKKKVLGMTPHRIAVEIFSHAIGYYLGDALKEANPDWANQLCNMGNPINVNKDDSRKALFYLVWNNPQKIKVAASAMGSPYAKYIK